MEPSALPPTPPELVHHVSAPQSQATGTSLTLTPQLARAFSAPPLNGTGLAFGRQQFTDTTFDLLLGPSQMERSPSSQPVESVTGTSFSAEENSSNTSSAARVNSYEELSTFEERVQRFSSNFGIATLTEKKLCFLEPSDSCTMVKLTVDEYDALHMFTGFPLQAGDSVFADEFPEVVKAYRSQGADDSGVEKPPPDLHHIEGKVTHVSDADNMNFADIEFVFENDSNVLTTVAVRRDDSTARKWPFKLKSLTPRVAEEVWLQPDIPSIEPQPSTRDERCCICLDTNTLLLKNICERPGELGLQPGSQGVIAQSCDVTCCVECFEAHVANSVSSAKFSVAPIRCPGAACGRRLPMERWAWAVCKSPSKHEISPLHSYLHNPKTLTSIRCPNCDSVQTLFPKPALGKEARIAALTGSPFRKLSEKCETQFFFDLEELWFKYSQGIVSASEVVSSFLTIVPFNDINGKNRGDYVHSKETCPEDCDDPVEMLMIGLLMLIVDVERRCALQLAWLRRFPLIYLNVCCYAEVCFKCKVEGFHEGQTCAERQAEELSIDAQYCPACGVATIRSEGCKHIVCVCGTHWHWEQDGDY